jgi:hypothetical protein
MYGTVRVAKGAEVEGWYPTTSSPPHPKQQYNTWWWAIEGSSGEQRGGGKGVPHTREEQEQS